MPPTEFAAKDRISLCMIVRNEAEKLGRALDSAAGWVGEIVVVDTGSTDETVAIAESYGARVVHFPWCDDFAAARNASLEAATGEWALVLDADEQLHVLDPAVLAAAVTQEAIEGFSFRCDNERDDGTLGRAMVFRLFRRTLPAMRYRGALHEQVARVADGRAVTAGLDALLIHHDGYTASAVSRGKVERNMALARKLTEARPDDPFTWYALGLSLAPLDPREMVTAYERALSLLGPSGAGEAYVLHLVSQLAQAHRLQQQPAKAVALLERWAPVFPASPDLRLAFGELKLQQHDFQGALAEFEACLTPEARAYHLIMDPAATGYAARTGLAIAKYNLGRYDEAERALESAVAEAPDAYALPNRMLGLIRAQRGAWADALTPLSLALTHAPSDDEVRFQLGWSLAKLERYDEADDVLAPLGDRQDVAHLRGRMHLERGEAESALVALGRCTLPAADLVRGWAHYVTGRPEAAAACWDAWLRAGAADWGTKDTLSMFLFLLQGGKRPTGQPERPAEPLRDMALWFRTLVRHQRFDDVEAAIKRGPELGDRLWRPLRVKFAAALAQEGFHDVALSLLLAAREAAPSDPEPYYWLGYCSLHKQLVSDAKVLWETCLTLSPGHEMATRALSLLR